MPKGVYDRATPKQEVEPMPAASFYEPTDPAEVRAQSLPVAEGVSADHTLSSHAMPATEEAPDLNSEVARIRALRKPLGMFSQKLALDKRSGYHRHWFNDVAGRIDEAKANGWAHIKGSDDKPIKRCVGSGRDKGALFAYAMEIPEVFWQEDMDARHKDAQARMDAIKKSPAMAKPGEAKQSDGGKFYSPREGVDPVQIVKG